MISALSLSFLTGGAITVDDDVIRSTRLGPAAFQLLSFDLV
jgi:hypothetical protein